MNRRDFLRTAGVLGAAAIVPLADELEDIARRMQRLAASNVDDATLSQLERMVDGLGRQYEVSDATAVYPAALRQRRWVDELLAGQQHPRQRAHLYGIAGKLSGLLGYLAFDRGNGLAARAYCDEAFTLAQTAGHRGLAAWIRGTQSFIAYYDGDYRQAFELARDGQRYAAGGPHSIRLAIAGEARTLGRLGDRAGVDDAVDRAFSARGRLDEADPVGYFLSFDPYPTARVAGNAASAYLALDTPSAATTARQYAEQALDVFTASPQSTASHALTLVDLATTHLAGPSPEPDHAGTLAADALTIGAQMHSEVVTRRTAAFLAAARRWHDVPEIAAFADATHDQQQPKALPAR